MRSIHLPRPPSEQHLESLRQEVRDFLEETLHDFPPVRRAENWNGFDRQFGRKLGARGWIGMTWPVAYGGQGRTFFERYVIWEELLAAGAPIVSALPVDRQTGPLLLEYASEEVKRFLLPRMARGELVFCVGMSESGSGSDLASVRSRATRTASGWRLNGTKIWTSYAHESDYMIGLFRTGDAAGAKHEGMSQFLIDLKTPGIAVKPIVNLQGQGHFNECTFENVDIPAEALIGKEGDGWKQVTRELAFERSGPERYLSSHQLFVEMVHAAETACSPTGTASIDSRVSVQIGSLFAEMAALREMSRGVATLISNGKPAAVAAALVKERGAAFEQKIPEAAHSLFGSELGGDLTALEAVAGYTTQAAPQYSIRGGTREILRGIIARGLTS